MQVVYDKILGLLSRGGPHTRKYSLVEVVENDCIVTRVRVYDEISPESSGNPYGSAPRKSPESDYIVV